MRITIYKRYNDYISLDFKPNRLDEVRELCYSEGIKWYTISYSEGEQLEYDRLSKRNN
mgnify:FL=1|jgi:hypothetical protein|tara:strand:- start:103 stop:276 length:174 start_codon:yes stop_codon:yes gene_type:complete